jgi:hypothetical protein
VGLRGRGPAEIMRAWWAWSVGAWRRSSGPVGHGPGRAEGCRPGGDRLGLLIAGLVGLRSGGLRVIKQACEGQAWLGWRSRVRGVEIPRLVEQWICGPMGQSLACNARCLLVNCGMEKPSMS